MRSSCSYESNFLLCICFLELDLIIFGAYFFLVSSCFSESRMLCWLMRLSEGWCCDGNAGEARSSRSLPLQLFSCLLFLVPLAAIAKDDSLDSPASSSIDSCSYNRFQADDLPSIVPSGVGVCVAAGKIIEAAIDSLPEAYPLPASTEDVYGESPLSDRLATLCGKEERCSGN